MSDYNIDSLAEKSKYAPVVARICEEHKKATGVKCDGYIPIMGSQLKQYPEKIIREAYRIYMREHRGKHPNYFFGIVKSIYKQIGNSEFTGEVL